MYAALDVLGSTPWQINCEIFDVILQVLNLGQRLGKLSPLDFDEPEVRETVSGCCELD